MSGCAKSSVLANVAAALASAKEVKAAQSIGVKVVDGFVAINGQCAISSE